MPSSHPAHLAMAFATGGLLTLMILFNGQFAEHGTPLFASWAAHGTGMIAALAILALVPRLRGASGRSGAPAWAYLGGISGAATVMLTSTTVNSALALSGTLALGLAGQVVFGLLTDRFGLLGLPRRGIAARDLAALAMIVAGSLMIIFAGGA